MGPRRFKCTRNQGLMVLGPRHRPYSTAHQGLLRRWWYDDSRSPPWSTHPPPPIHSPAHIQRTPSGNRWERMPWSTAA